MTFEELKDKANSLPFAPGVYIMRDKNDKVIYVGKAKKLKNRVSQYFQDTASHTPKTRLMVSHIHHFDVIVAASEFEALVLECSLIKQHLPKYNILLKDDKGYPYIRLDMKEDYPQMTIVSKLAQDGASYFGPFGSRGVTKDLIEALCISLKLPRCSKRFPRDIGKARPCLNYHMGQCSAWCQGRLTKQDYRQQMEQARELLSGNYKKVAEQIKAQMLHHAENLEFELAAGLRDRLNSIETLGKKQLVTAATLADMDVIGYAANESKACFAVLHFSGGNLLDKDYEVFPAPDDPEAAVSSLIKQYYLSRGIAPKVLLLPFAVDDAELFTQLMEQRFGKKSKLRIPQRGDNLRLVELAQKNALEEAQRVTGKEDRINGTLALLGKMLAMTPPKRIESYDISNIAGTDIVAGMVVYEDGKAKKSEFKRFRIEGLSDQDDYASMEQVVRRRLLHLQAGDKGFDKAPDLMLIDGGMNHAAVALGVVQELEMNIPVFGMVKDDRHRTRALVTPEGFEIAIDSNQAIFAFIGNIQEDTHNWAIGYHRQLRSKRLRYSQLTQIPGIGEKRKQQLLKIFGSIQSIASASLDELERILPKDAARAVYDHFKTKEDTL